MCDGDVFATPTHLRFGAFLYKWRLRRVIEASHKSEVAAELGERILISEWAVRTKRLLGTRAIRVLPIRAQCG